MLFGLLYLSRNLHTESRATSGTACFAADAAPNLRSPPCGCSRNAIVAGALLTSSPKRRDVTENL